MKTEEENKNLLHHIFFFIRKKSHCLVTAIIKHRSSHIAFCLRLVERISREEGKKAEGINENEFSCFSLSIFFILFVSLFL
jgi:hypothetical protein